MTKRFARKLTSLGLTAVMLVTMSGFNLGCFTQTIDVGTGAAGGQEVELNQWFALWGLVPITQLDAEEAIGGAENYTITSEFTPLDSVINIFTSWVTVYRKSIIIEK